MLILRIELHENGVWEVDYSPGNSQTYELGHEHDSRQY